MQIILAIGMHFIVYSLKVFTLYIETYLLIVVYTLNDKVFLDNEGIGAILVDSFQYYKKENYILGNIFDETHACNSSSSNSIENTNLIYDLERMEVI